MERYKRKFKEGYNGYTNYETWNVVLWIDNEESLYREKLRNIPFTARSAEDWVMEIFPGGTPDMQSARDYKKVNWREVAEMFNEG